MRTKVKICGVTRPEDAYCAERAGAHAVGMVFYPPSSRYVGDALLARDIAQALGPFTMLVGLFVNPKPVEVEALLQHVPINLLQFHGSESEAFCQQFAHPYVKALRMKDDIDVPGAIAAYPSSRAILLDAYRAGKPGGTGEVFNWQRVPKDCDKPIVLAGGLTAENVAEAIETVQPYAVDVSGGIESAFGVKSHDKIRAFMRSVEAAKVLK